MYDEPSRVDALRKHRLNPKGILRLRRLFLATNNQDKAAEFRTHSKRKRATVELRREPRFATGPVYNTASPEIFGTGALIRLAKPAGLKCRCDQLQVLSRGFIFVGPEQDSLYEPTSILPVVCVKECSLIGVNTLQRTRQRVLVLSGRMHCKGTKTDNSHSN
jgi:hypothetical protein